MGFFDWLKPSPPLDATLRARVDQAAAAIDPRIRQLGTHEKILAPAVTQAWDYCERLALAIPGPFAVAHAAFASDPLVHALFGSADDVYRMLATSQSVREYLAGHPAEPHFFALLGMRRKVVAGYGMRLAGEMVRGDEPVKTLSFADHTIGEVGASLDEVQGRLARTMFDSLLQGLLPTVEALRQERIALQEDLALTRVRVRQGSADATRQQAALESRLREIAAALEPERLCADLAAHLAYPESVLHLDTLRYRIDRFGVIAEDAAQKETDALRFVELVGRDQRHWTVMLVKIDNAEARTAIERFEAGRRYIVI